MKGLSGFRSNKSFTTTAGVAVKVDDGGVGGVGSGAYSYIEVTNTTASTVHVTLNDFSNIGVEDGTMPFAGGSTAGMPASDPIPVYANSTREIPMVCYNLKADGVVDVVAYRM